MPLVMINAPVICFRSRGSSQDNDSSTKPDNGGNGQGAMEMVNGAGQCFNYCGNKYLPSS